MQQLPIVRDTMQSRFHKLTPDTPILEAIRVLIRSNASGLPVVEGKKLVGFLSSTDCLKLLAEGVGGDVPDGPVRGFMSHEVKTVPPDMDVYYLAGLFRRYPVVEDGELIGVISRHDVLEVIQRFRKKPASGKFARLA